MRRREAVAALAALGFAPGTLAQAGRAARVSIVFAPPEKAVKAWETAFLEALQTRGYERGRNLVFDVRYADGDASRVSALVDEAIAANPDVLAGFESVAKVMLSRTASIPIVLTNSSDPVGLGLARNLARPGGNVTGVSLNHELLTAKVLEMLKEVLPRLARVGLLLDATSPGSRLVEANAHKVAPGLGVLIEAHFAGNRAELEKALEKIGQARLDALVFGSLAPALLSHSDLVYQAVRRIRLPFAIASDVNAENAFVLAYGADVAQGYRDAAGYVARILKGARPDQLPIQQPTRFVLTVNLKHARGIGIDVPHSLLLRADRVIE